MDFEMELRKITEAYCVLNGIPVTRIFEDAELEDSFRAIRQVNAERESHESRTEEDKREDDMDRQRAYPERRP